MLKKLTNNLSLKLLSIVFAMILWLVVVSIEDPENSRTFTLPVTIENEDYITEMGMTYEVLNGSDTVRITVTAKRSLLEDMTSSDFEAVADMENIDSEMEKVLIQITSRYNSNQVNIIGQMQYLDVQIEKRLEQKYRVAAEVEGQPAEGYAVGSVTLSPNVLTVSGPESVMSKLSKVVAIVDVNGITSDATLAVKPTYYDEAGNKLDTSRLNVNVSEVTASVTLNNVKTVPVEVDISGEPAEGYAFQSVQADVDLVAVKGSDTALEACSKITVTGLSIAGATEDVEFDVELSNFLPDGIEIADNTETVHVTAFIEQNVERALTFRTSEITVDNLPDGYELAFENETFSVNVLALSSVWEIYSADNVTLSLDASNLTEGRNYVTVHTEFPKGFTVMNPPKLYVSVSAAESPEAELPEEAEGNEDENGNGDGNGNGAVTDNTEDNETQGDTEEE